MAETITLKRVYEELKTIERQMETKDDLHQILATLEIMGNQETMEQIERSKGDIQHGRFKQVTSTQDFLKKIDHA
ncbi:hypothetical protein HYU13_04650 [Candidatus Woesearchaeota archaeon]|nr:hypothetical protein [Candidatus Woesearchaeota archaeon]